MIARNLEWPAMILIGQYDSPFVRRVGIALELFGLAFEHRPWSTFGDAEKIRPINPLTRVPTLVLDDGTVLTDSHIMLDYLDSRVPTAKRLFPQSEPQRHQCMRVCGFATGIGDKTVSLFYEIRLHSAVSDLWVARCQGQIRDTLAMLERERAAIPGDFWVGDRLSHADIAMTCIARFVMEAHPGLVDPAELPALTADAQRFEALPEFQRIKQVFIPPT
jgi:glutathione S-transferase